MRSLEVAAVSRDPVIKSELARAFDAAPLSWNVTLHETAPEDADVVVLGPELEGDGIVFDPEHPESVIEEISARTETSKVFVVTSTGGGTGLTTVALHLAAAAAVGARSCCVETGPGGMALRLGLPDGVSTWAEVTEPDADIESAAIPVPGGYRVLLAPAGAGSEVHGITTRAFTAFEVVVAEVAPGSPSIEAARAAVLVMPPTIPGAARARAVLDAWPDTRWAIVTNRLGPGGEATRAALEKILNRKIALELPTCPALRDAEDTGRLLTSPLYGWSRAIRRLWRALEVA